MKTGIYKITNKINGNSYIGMSIDIERRWQVHRNRFKDQNSREYNYVLYKAFRKYGLENFTFTILELCSSNLLEEREIYWIEYYNTYHGGYNSTPGGNCAPVMPGEKHPNHKLTELDVIEIRERWTSCTISTRELYYDYQDKIKKTGFKKVYSWQTWKHILPELNTQERRDWHRHNLNSYSNWGEKSPNSLITDEEYEQILSLRKESLSYGQIFEKLSYLSDRYKNLASFKSSMYSRKKDREKK